MTAIAKIPHRIHDYPLSSIATEIDCKGLCCSMKLTGGGGDIFLNNSEDCFPIAENEIFEFSGKILVKPRSGYPVAHCLFYHTA